MKLIYLLFVFVLGLTACSQGNLYIDNPDTALKRVEVDGQKLVIEGKGAAILTVKGGKHKIVIRDENHQVLKDTLFYLGKGGLLRVAPARYVRWRELYGDEAYREKKLNKNKIEFGNWVFTGDFTEYNPKQLYIEQDWDFDLNQSFPKDRIGWDIPGNDKYIIKSKIYRIEDFMKEVKKK